MLCGRVKSKDSLWNLKFFMYSWCSSAIKYSGLRIYSLAYSSGYSGVCSGGV